MRGSVTEIFAGWRIVIGNFTTVTVRILILQLDLEQWRDFSGNTDNREFTVTRKITE